MTTLTTHKLNVNTPTGCGRQLRRAASSLTAIEAGFTDGSLAVRCRR